jgi:hypothetical protein
MIIDVKEWTRRLQEVIDQTFPGMQLKVEENVKSLRGMIKDSHRRRGISDEAAQQKEIPFGARSTGSMESIGCAE